MTRYTLSLWLCNLYVGYIIQYAGLDKFQAGIKIAGRSTNIQKYEYDTTLIAESKRTKEPHDEERRWKNYLKVSIQKTIHKKCSTFMASSPTTSWHIGEGKVETVANFIFLGFKITMDLD